MLPHISGLDCDLDSAGDFDRCDFDFEAPFSSPHLAFLALLALLALPAAPPLALSPATSQTICPTPYYLPYSLHLPYSPSSLSFCDFVVFGFPWRCGRVFPMIVCHLFCYKP